MTRNTLPLVRSLNCLLGLALVSAASAASPPLQGKWAGERVSMTFDAQGATITLDCARGRIAAPILPDHHGGFTAFGTFEMDQPGPQHADEPAQARTARFSGQLRGATMKLSIERGGGEPVQQVTLVRGASVKFVRCL